MSDLAATNCGGCNCSCGGDNGGCNCIFLILILLCCGGNSWGGNGGCGGGDNCILIILLILCCGGNGNGVLGCGC